MSNYSLKLICFNIIAIVCFFTTLLADEPGQGWPLQSEAIRQSCRFVRQELMLDDSRLFMFSYDGGKIIQIWLEPCEPYGILWGSDVSKPGTPSLSRNDTKVMDIVEIAISESNRLLKLYRAASNGNEKQKSDIVAILNLATTAMKKPLSWPFERNP